MSRIKPQSADRLAIAVARFGEPEVVYKPSPGQTFGGVMLGLVVAVGAFAATLGLFISGVGLGSQILTAGLGLAGLGLAYWLYRLGKWRLLICPRGLVQVGAWGTDEVAWSEVREVLDTRVKGAKSTSSVSVIGPAGKMVVVPYNVRGWRQVLKALLEAAGRRGIPIRIEWVERSDPVHYTG